MTGPVEHLPRTTYPFLRFEQKHFLHYNLKEDESVSRPDTAARGEALHYTSIIRSPTGGQFRHLLWKITKR